MAACSPLDTDMDWARDNLALHSARVYRSLEEMLEHRSLEALLIASATKVHFEQVLTGIRNRLYVLVGKPLAMNTQQSQETANFARQPQNAHLKVVTASSR